MWQIKLATRQILGAR